MFTSMVLFQEFMDKHQSIAARPGLFITFEGPEGAGKSTQIKLLARRLEDAGRQVLATREPGGTPLAERIRGLLMEFSEEGVAPLCELLLFAAGRAQHTEKRILPHLRQGGIVLCDRFIDSTLAYQGFARHLDMQAIRFLNELVLRERKPDLTFLLDIPVEESLRRTSARDGEKADRFAAENLEFYGKVRDGFLKIAEEEPERIRIIDGLAPQEEVAARIWREVSHALG